MVAGCAEFEYPYISSGVPRFIGGGYSEVIIGENEYLVSFEGNVYTRAETLRKYLDRRSADLCGTDNYLLKDSSESFDSSMVYTSGMFLLIPNPINTVNVKCKSPKKEYLLRTLVGGEGEYCELKVFNSTRLLTFESSVEVYINDVYISSLSYKQYFTVPVLSGKNVIRIANPFGVDSRKAEYNIEVDTLCNKHLEVGQGFASLYINEISDIEEYIENNYVENFKWNEQKVGW